MSQTLNMHSYPSRVCCHWLGAMPAQHVKASERAHEDTSPAKIDVTSKSPVGDISVVTLIRTDTTLDHSQKAEKVCSVWGSQTACKLDAKRLCALSWKPIDIPGNPAGERSKCDTGVRNVFRVRSCFWIFFHVFWTGKIWNLFWKAGKLVAKIHFFVFLVDFLKFLFFMFFVHVSNLKTSKLFPVLDMYLENRSALCLRIKNLLEIRCSAIVEICQQGSECFFLFHLSNLQQFGWLERIRSIFKFWQFLSKNQWHWSDFSE